MDSWNIDKSKDLYGLDAWGCGYFSINEKGHVTVKPDGTEDSPSVDLSEVIDRAVDQGLQLPLLLRFNGILRSRIRKIYGAFASAIAEYEYTGQYVPAYPIKVNQQREVVDVVRSAGTEFSMGLEVGSKPELIAVLALHDDPDALLLCNGYKDRQYIELALTSQKIGRNPIITIEKYSELMQVLEIAEKLDVRPSVGFRLRPSGKGAGRWESSGGDRAKFGLTISEILASVKELERREMVDCVKLLHCHIGSQLTSISNLRGTLKEMSQIYVQLRQRCPNLHYLDIGGGLAVDYDGSRTTFASSMNYTVEEYARDVVWAVGQVCKEAEVPDPSIVTESGRAIAAHHSMLVFDVLGIANTFQTTVVPSEVLEQTESLVVRDLAESLRDLTAKNCHEALHDAIALRGDAITQFRQGILSIEDRAMADECFWALLQAIMLKSSELHYIPEDLERLPSLLSDTYFCNFSVFQSIPDSWAIQQIFPVSPLTRLNEEPTQPVVIADITCDSDGKIDRFADIRDVLRYLRAHKIQEGEKYYFGIYLVGAYQEILGDLHNLFGDTNAIHIEVPEEGKFEFSNVVVGDSIAEVLKYVQYSRQDLEARWQRAIGRALEANKITAEESESITEMYKQSFDGYTYLTP
jgi:arginine decarboxylase